MSLLVRLRKAQREEALHSHNFEEYEERAATAKRLKREATQTRRMLEAELWRTGRSIPAPQPHRWPLGKIAK